MEKELRLSYPTCQAASWTVAFWGWLRKLELLDHDQVALETYLALRTRLPSDQGLNTYYANVHRDWSWGDEENAASLDQLRSVLHDHAKLGRVLVLKRLWMSAMADSKASSSRSG